MKAEIRRFPYLIIRKFDEYSVYKDMKNQFAFYVVFLLLASFMRVFPHPVGCSPFIASALFITATSKDVRWYGFLPIFFAITAYIQSGVWIGWWIQPVSLLLILLTVKNFRLNSVASYASLGLVASFEFFLISNTGSWVVHALPYPMTFQGWLECMTLGLPYFRAQLFWDILFTTSVFSVYKSLVSRRLSIV